VISFYIPGEPVAFARSGGNGKIRFTPKRQRDHMALIKLAAATAMVGVEPFAIPLSVAIRATYLVPQSWPKKKRLSAKWKTSTPDCDNLAKIICDACNEIVFADDAMIAEMTIQKVYGPVAGVCVTVSPLDHEEGGQ